MTELTNAVRRDAIVAMLLRLPEEIEASLNLILAHDRKKQELGEKIKLEVMNTERAVTEETVLDATDSSKSPKKAYPNQALRDAETARRLGNNPDYKLLREAADENDMDLRAAQITLEVLKYKFRAYEKLADLETDGGRTHG